ncbi:MAG: adenylosuccinate synthase [Lentisphaerae bacterium]|nr:adenylosuccinate synthase [Lentisphaerota bacterium]
MPSFVIVGAQWGDEGKGKLVDAASAKADIVVRFQGGDNAGHTVWNDGVKNVLHILPSGILRPEVLCVIGGGVVINLEKMVDELKSADVPQSEWQKRLAISAEAHLILPCHVALDKAAEEALGSAKIGTTLRGIGPAYADRSARLGVRMGDLLSKEHFMVQLQKCLDAKKLTLDEKDRDINAIADRILAVAEPIKPLICDTSLILENAYKANKNILFEGAQGAMLDVSFGSYPFVTSSHTVAGSAAVGSGVGPHRLNKINGVVKAYTTRVGEGPFPSELKDAIGDRLRDIGNEYGATTGRPRRCGWIDFVALRRAIRTGSLDGLILTKLDVLDEFDEIGYCDSYEINGETVKEWPFNPEQVAAIKPIFNYVKGWKSPTDKAQIFEELPVAAQEFIKLIESKTDLTVTAISAGVDRKQLIVRVPFF